jgi:hypothetical protein
MMQLINNYAIYALVIVNTFLLFRATVMLRETQSLILQDKRKENPSPVKAVVSEGVSIRNQAKSYAAMSQLLDSRLNKMQLQIQEVLNKKTTTVATPRPAQMPIEHAMRLARHGASAADLSRTCGLNKEEAKLMHRLHASSIARAATAH